jgi:Zn-dependent M32 family carboxypeptidase
VGGLTYTRGPLRSHCLQGRPAGEVDGLPVTAALSMGVHESQSLLWERCIALSRPFAAYLLPKLRAHFPSQARAWGGGVLGTGVGPSG